MARFRRLARDDERLPETLAGLHVLAFAMRTVSAVEPLMLKRCAERVEARCAEPAEARFITVMLEST